jgi:hypothetical protein
LESDFAVVGDWAQSEWIEDPAVARAVAFAVRELGLSRTGLSITWDSSQRSPCSSQDDHALAVDVQSTHAVKQSGGSENLRARNVEIAVPDEHQGSTIAKCTGNDSTSEVLPDRKGPMIKDTV